MKSIVKRNEKMVDNIVNKILIISIMILLFAFPIKAINNIAINLRIGVIETIGSFVSIIFGVFLIFKVLYNKAEEEYIKNIARKNMFLTVTLVLISIIVLVILGNSLCVISPFITIFMFEMFYLIALVLMSLGTILNIWYNWKYKK